MKTTEALKKVRILEEDGRRMIARAAKIKTAITVWEDANNVFSNAKIRYPIEAPEYIAALGVFNQAGKDYQEAIKEIQPKKFVWPLD